MERFFSFSSSVWAFRAALCAVLRSAVLCWVLLRLWFVSCRLFFFLRFSLFPSHPTRFSSALQNHSFVHCGWWRCARLFIFSLYARALRWNEASTGETVRPTSLRYHSIEVNAFWHPSHTHIFVYHPFSVYSCRTEILFSYRQPSSYNGPFNRSC